MLDNDINNHTKREFNLMNTDLIDIDPKPSKRIVVSKLQTPTKINQISSKSDYDIDFSRNKSNKRIDNNLDLFYQENESKLRDLENKLETLNQKSEEQNKIYLSLGETLNDDYNLKRENLQEIVDNLMERAQDIKNSTDDLKGSFNEKSESLNKRYASKQLEISKIYRNKLETKTQEFLQQREKYEEEVKIDKENLRSEIDNLNTQIEEKAIYFHSNTDFQNSKKQLAIEINNIRSENFEQLNKKTEMLMNQNKDLRTEIDVLEKNIQSKLMPKNASLKSNIQKENETLQMVNETRKKKIEESATLAKQYEKMQLKYNSLQSELSIYETKIKSLKESIQHHKDELQKKETNRRVLHNELQDLRGNIRVFCRIKPETNSQFTLKEINTLDPDESINEETLSKFDRAQLQIEMPNDLLKRQNSSPRKQQHNNTVFEFDKIFNEKSTNEEVFDEVSQLVQSSLDGYKVCIFAYGQTGSGKTYTMLNPVNGIIPSTLRHIYTWVDDLKGLGWDYKMKIQFVEIYNDTINDLLAFNNNSTMVKRSLMKKKIDIRHANGNTTLTNVEQIDITNINNVEDILSKAKKYRATNATKENENSSRSHSVFTIFLEGFNKLTNEHSNGVLNLIDLAGSERLSKSQAAGDRLKETQHINKSLSCLGDVIHSLSQSQKPAHIPFRNSKLTYMLQNYLTGEGKTLMFVNVSTKSYFETLNSLRFSTKVNDTKMK
ncbi:uncharacterized protein HGUI_02155 [Hanseniaspora guilliermondii]|uniref:Kinesin-like protein n=1 Tax=Hanseniaspora guilliermondii TaxID=56406 RepID=A0A1L0B4K6_9ASCO|nr:uncharacterized protein HGUI_02155 [Hanseniaspora guilliermondii]